MNHLTRAKSVFEMEIEELRGVLSRLDDSFNKAVDLMSDALDRGNKIVIVGVGKSGNIGEKIVATLNSTGTPTVMLDSLNALHGDLGIVQDGDVCIAMSFSGETSELLTLLPFIKRFELPIISMTGNVNSSLAKYSDIVLDTGVSREACPLNLAPTSSTTAMLVMGDALAMALLEARNFTARDFAKRHPGGSLGRALLTKVGDIMRQGADMAILPDTVTVNDCLKAMTEAHAGACILLSADEKLAGIFTHGDFVRAYGANPLIGETPVNELMTRNPIYVKEDDLAAEAVKAVSHRHIDDLVVLNNDMKPVGIVDLQDLARLKLV
ncbi:MAG: KpsF/GutQ family sugar-phosphate isomerase [Akkermansia sp.]|nr:KpsF/GutQ family sugar-phosphate isomerase [Akkermansia sp.]